MEVKKIEIYSTPTCGFCHMLKAYLDSKKVKYIDYDLAQDYSKADEMMEISGQSGVPVMIINRSAADQQIIVGFNKTKIDELLGL